MRERKEKDKPRREQKKERCVARCNLLRHEDCVSSPPFCLEYFAMLALNMNG